MESLLRISASTEGPSLPPSFKGPPPDLISEIESIALKFSVRIVQPDASRSGSMAAPSRASRESPFSPNDLIIPLGSAGVFSAIYQAISIFLEQHTDSRLW